MWAALSYFIAVHKVLSQLQTYMFISDVISLNKIIYWPQTFE